MSVVVGVMWPAACLVVEMLSGMASQIWIDPIPTKLHIAAIAWVAIANAALFHSLANGKRVSNTFFMLHGLGLGISIFYIIQLLPFLIPGVFFFWLGIGLLPLGPWAAMLAAKSLRKRALETGLAATSTRDNCLAAVAGFMLMLLLEIPTMTSAFGLTLAANGNAEQRAWGRKFISLARMDSELPRFAAGEWPARFWFYLDNVTQRTGLKMPDAAAAQREIYRATGQALSKTHRTRYGLDEGRAGTRVGSLLPSLALAESKVEVVANAPDGLSYSEWTMVFRNDYFDQKEGRCELQLPTGGVVSRLTLWVNGEEREAAFAGSAHVREAYTRIVAQRRDPVLVTAAGPGRVLVQCFPVPSRGTMKIRFGVTAPLQPETEGRARYTFPIITDANFQLPTETSVTVKGAATSLNSAKLHSTTVAPGFDVPMPATETVRWVRDPRGEQFLVQRISPTEAPAARAVIVVDRSASLAKFAGSIARTISKLPDAPVLIATADEPVREGLSWSEFAGGGDNVRALEAAVELAGREGRDTIVWIHGPQPVLLTPIERLNSKLSWHRDLRIVPVQLEPGENLILRELDYATRIESRADLASVEDLIGGKEKVWQTTWTNSKEKPAGLPVRESSFHLARLWANQAVADAIVAGDPIEAVNLAQRYQLVTAVSGAVVLETKEQFNEAGLAPVDPATVPTVPEPGVGALLAAGGAALLLRRRRG